jgi:hypothetical protein
VSVGAAERERERKRGRRDGDGEGGGNGMRARRRWVVSINYLVSKDGSMRFRSVELR